MEECGWEKLELGWRKRLKSKKKIPYGKIDCGAEGDCLFSCISNAFKNISKPEDNAYETEEIRKLVASEEMMIILI